MNFKFSIITPAHNSEKYIRETIESVIKQKGDFSIEYFVLDNHSSDRTCSIVMEYQELLAAGKMVVFCRNVRLHLISEPDLGMYDAINNGFKRASGDIFAWINSDDIYLQGAFDIIQRTLSAYPQIQWLKGITSYLNKNSNIFASGRCNLYSQDWLAKGLYGPVMHFVQQDSVFWRASLWKLSGGIDHSYSSAGDFALWRKFAKHTALYSIKAFVSCFRKIPGQKSEDINAYWQEINDYDLIKHKYKLVKRYFSLESILPHRLRPLCYRLISGKQQFHLVTLENNMEPYLRNGSYYELKKVL